MRTVVLLLVALASAPGCLLRARRSEPPIAGSIHIEGARQVSESDVLERMALIGSGRWLFGLTGKHPFDPDLVPDEARRVERIYRAFGHYEARVTDTRVHVRHGRADVTFVVEEGPPTRVSERRIDGLEAMAHPERLTRALPLAEGEVLVETNYERLKVELRERLRNEGHLEAQVAGRVEVDRERSIAKVFLEVAPGTSLHVGRIFVAGAQAVSRDRIAQATGLTVGETITPEKLERAQRGVYALGIFNLVQVDPAAEETPGRAPVVVTVHEAPFIQRELALGIVTDPTRWVGQVRGLWQHKNLARGLQQLTLSGGLGYAVLPGLPQWLFGGEVSGRGVVADAKAEYLQPRIARSNVDGLAALDYAKDVTSAFEFQRTGLKLAFPLHLDAMLRGTTLTTSLAYDYYFDVSQHDAIPAGTSSTFATSGCGAPAGTTVSREQCVIGYVEERLSIDRRDDPISAHRGWYLSASAQYAGLPGSEFDYVRLFPEARAYLPLSTRTTLALRGRWGMLLSLDGGARELPGVAKFFAGGANSVRVVGAQQLGPRDFLVVDNPDGSKPGRDRYAAGSPLPTGGNRLLEGSIELRMPTAWHDVGWVLFADAGAVDNVAPTSRELWPGGEIVRYGLGLGLRIRTPVGPIRLDLAQRLTSWSQTPTAVRTNLAGGKAAADEFVRLSDAPPYRSRPLPAAGQSDTPLASEYRIATDCRALGYPTSPGDPGYDTQSHKCFEEGGVLSGLQFFLTIGEAF